MFSKMLQAVAVAVALLVLSYLSYLALLYPKTGTIAFCVALVSVGLWGAYLNVRDGLKDRREKAGIAEEVAEILEAEDW